MTPDLSADDLFHYAHIAKEYNLLNPWARKFLYSMGVYTSRGYTLSEAQQGCYERLIGDLQQMGNEGRLPCPKTCAHCRKLRAITTAAVGKGARITYKNPYKQDSKYSAGWVLSKPLYLWQKRYLDEWLRLGRGILQVVTGAGKTMFALAGIEKLTDKGRKTDIRIFIIVPTIPLLYQWQNSLVQDLNVNPSDIGVFCGLEKGDYLRDRVQLYTINTARELLPAQHDSLKKKKGIRSILIADECHRYGSKENKKIFDGKHPFDWTLGLSATPETQSHFGFDTVLRPKLGEIILQPFTYADALREGIIPRFVMVNCRVSLTDSEIDDYDSLSEGVKRLAQQIEVRYPELKRARNADYFKVLGQLAQEHKDRTIEQYLGMLNQRRAILHETPGRMEALARIVAYVEANLPNSKVIIFHERIAYAEAICDALARLVPASLYHSEISDDDRKEALSAFAEGQSRYIVTCRALDEGIDVPDAAVGVIVAGTKGVRQRIQRMGRILRKAPGKDFALIFTIYVEGYEDEIVQTNDAELVDEVEIRYVTPNEIQELPTDFGPSVEAKVRRKSIQSTKSTRSTKSGPLIRYRIVP